MFWGEVNDYDFGRPSNRPEKLCQQIKNTPPPPSFNCCPTVYRFGNIGHL
jgi:hypothetical protein